MSDVNPFNAGPGELSSDYPDPDDYCEDEDDCYECGGEGWVEAECEEDSCCCTEPHPMIPCPLCNPEGK